MAADELSATELLLRAGSGDTGAVERIFPLVYDRADLVLALDEALDRLRTLDARQARVVECRYFGGMTADETAEAIGIGVRTVKRDWAKARSWLYAELYDGPVT